MLNEYPNAINILRSLYNSECSRNQNIRWINYQKNMILYCKMKESKKINGYIDDKDDEFDINKVKYQLPEVCTNCEFKNECLTFRDEKLLFENLRLLLEQVVV